MNIKLKILVFALLSVLAPFSIFGYFAYNQYLEMNQARFGLELHSLGTVVAGELSRRVERLRDDVQAFSTSPLLNKAIVGDETALLGSAAYFKSIRDRFPEFTDFSLHGADGKAISAPGTEQAPIQLKAGTQAVKGEAGQTTIQLTLGVQDPSEQPIGFLLANVSLQVLQPLMASTVPSIRLYLVSGAERLLSASGTAGYPAPVTEANRRLVSGFGDVMIYFDHRGIEVFGVSVYAGIPGLQVLAELDAERAFKELAQLQKRALWMLVLVLLPLMFLAYLFGLSLTRPLDDLKKAVEQVGKGSLEVNPTSIRRDEIGYLSRGFSDMVARLRDSRREVVAAQSRLLEQNRILEQISVTDNLTGLPNRRRLADKLMENLERFQRNNLPFSALMLDLDKFKSVNDRYGHLAGDRLLCRFATFLSASIRSVDFAARYGGEEFTVILFETDQAAAWETAERIRAGVERLRVEEEPDQALSVTVSIGITVVCDNDKNPEDLIRRADAALYQAKQAGRNRVCFASAGNPDVSGSLGRS